MKNFHIHVDFFEKINSIEKLIQSAMIEKFIFAHLKKKINRKRNEEHNNYAL